MNSLKQIWSSIKTEDMKIHKKLKLSKAFISLCKLLDFRCVKKVAKVMELTLEHMPNRMHRNLTI